MILQTALLILIGVLLFGFIIFVHEFGHFFTAKLSRIRVNEFAIGMGPRLFSFTRGETQYTLRLLPIGGYCAMEGEDEKSDNPHAFGNRPVWQRMLVVLAGGVMNILFAILLMMVLRGQQELYGTNQVARLPETSAFAASGMQVEDYITEIDGYGVSNAQDLSFALSLASLDADGSGTTTLDLTLKRGDQTVTLPDVTVNTQEVSEGQHAIVLDFSVLGVARSPWTLVKASFTDTFSTVRMIFETLKGIVTGRFGLNELAGPIGTAQAVSAVASAGLERGFGEAVNNIIYMMLVISVNLGIVNLLPLPALDGGRFIFLLVELVLRRPVPARWERWVHTGGLVALLSFMVIVSFNDIVRIVTGGQLGG